MEGKIFPGDPEKNCGNAKAQNGLTGNIFVRKSWDYAV